MHAFVLVMRGLQRTWTSCCATCSISMPCDKADALARRDLRPLHPGIGDGVNAIVDARQAAHNGANGVGIAPQADPGGNCTRKSPLVARNAPKASGTASVTRSAHGHQRHDQFLVTQLLQGRIQIIGKAFADGGSTLQGPAGPGIGWQDGKAAASISTR